MGDKGGEPDRGLDPTSAGLAPGATVHVTNAKPNNHEGRMYSLDEMSK